MSLPSPPSIVCAPSVESATIWSLPRPPVRLLVPSHAGQEIVAVAAVERVVAVAAVEAVVAVPARQLVVAAVAEEDVVAGLAGQLVVAVAADMKSSSLPPSMTSSPASPFSWSKPSPPLMMSAPARPLTMSSPPSALIVSSPIVPVSDVAVIGAGDRLARRRGAVGMIAGREIGVGEVVGIGVLEDDESLPVRAAVGAVLVPLRARCRRRPAAAEGSPEPNGLELPSQPESRLSSEPSSPESRNMSPPAPAVKSVTMIAAVPTFGMGDLDRVAAACRW